MGLRVNLPHVIMQVGRISPTHGAALEEFERHLRETVQGKHTLQELAEVYCIIPKARPKAEEDEPRHNPDAIYIDGR